MSRFELWNGPPKATQEIRACLFGLVQSLLDLALNLFCVPGNRVLFKFGGERGAPLPADLLLRRCLDIASICLINIQAGHYEVQGFDSRPLMVKLRQVRISEVAVVHVETNQMIGPTFPREWPWNIPTTLPHK